MTNTWLEKIKKVTSRTLDLPENILMEIPKITVIGQFHIYIENHKGILSFSNEKLSLLLVNGSVVIVGKNFVLKKLFIDEVMLEGIIDKIEFIEK